MRKQVGQWQVNRGGVTVNVPVYDDMSREDSFAAVTAVAGRSPQVIAQVNQVMAECDARLQRGEMDRDGNDLRQAEHEAER